MAELVLSAKANGRATLTLNRPAQRNATSLELLDALDEAVAEIESDDEVRVAVLAGAGRAFCAGLDLKQVQAGRETVDALLTRLSLVARRIRRLPMPTIAMVQGAAIGGGCCLMLVTDFAVTHVEAKVGYPPLEMNLSPALLAPWLMRKIGPGRARAMLLAGGSISGAAAHEAGLATHLVDRSALESAVGALAAQLMMAGPEAARRLKALLNELDGSLDDAALDRAAACSVAVIASDEARSALRRALGG